MSIVLKAEVREQVGSLASKKIKREGLIPAVIYSKEKNINISLNSRDFEQQFFKGIALTSVIDLEISGKKTRVIAHKIDLDPVSDYPVHIDFMLCEINKPIRAKPKINFLNQDKSPGLKKGGFLHRRKARLHRDAANSLIICAVGARNLYITLVSPRCRP